MKICWDNLEKIKLSVKGNFAIGVTTYYYCVDCHKEAHKLPGCGYNELGDCI
jgi:hypothetical protein